MTKQYRHYTEFFKEHAVKRVLDEREPLAQVARQLDLSQSLLQQWCENYKTTGTVLGPGRGRTASAKAEGSDKERIRQLEEQVRQLTMEREILKKAAAYFAKESV